MRFQPFYVLVFVLGVCGSLFAIRETLADVPRASDVPPLVRKLNQGDAKARAAAARELGEIGLVKASYAKPAIPALMYRALRDPEVDVRRAALIALGQVDPSPKQVMPVFIEALKDPNEQVKIAAAQGVSHLGGNAQPAVPELQKIRNELNKLEQKERDKKRGLMNAVNDAMQIIRSSPKWNK